ncbi:MULTISPECIES: helix-turn-helix transcriptional regulator [unclassified Undibacterium]|uniref:helix-turn-helix domain-containing protein n=1 Tax=unclassified Undibacterium TaxID=2630295 RepID=UPI002AC96E0A|nr:MULTISPECIES: helix-turn-helix transcriptional regulator [unclassified Undibacterium]MEB0140132.1 helix-turn-helix transcriptional regulator [Undibacterium sp. CCC2.1]MEB0173600.1 helix-turn-helix transcriptional regulator [Undibacterium sp. CCC1.1]MEB0177543.1 helix-turn-helix transcriptional regulator [Undibacterium sp. CCC3.4]MEB0214453.1 helix-turn-helix transcriptional regulator [Undibacterium sp. 5I2]WPX42850.1 helix-turn-helix transcriptional regulator [Undibacterium sp. CCC3.4]
MNQLNNEELESLLGETIKRIRLLKNIDQQTLCAQAGLSVTALKNLETGHGASVKTLIKVLRGLGKTEWLQSLSPIATINPMTLLANQAPRQRARRSSKE